MTSLLQSIAGPVAIATLLAMLAAACPIPLALADCSGIPNDVTTSMQIDECGSLEFQFSAGFPSGMGGDGGIDDARGACVGNYLNCQDQMVQAGTRSPSESMHYYFSGDWQEGFFDIWWSVIEYQTPTYSACTSGDTTNGLVETVNQTYHPSEGYETISCSNNVY